MRLHATAAVFAAEQRSGGDEAVEAEGRDDTAGVPGGRLQDAAGGTLRDAGELGEGAAAAAAAEARAVAEQRRRRENRGDRF